MVIVQNPNRREHNLTVKDHQISHGIHSPLEYSNICAESIRECVIQLYVTVLCLNTKLQLTRGFLNRCKYHACAGGQAQIVGVTTFLLLNLHCTAHTKFDSCKHGSVQHANDPGVPVDIRLPNVSFCLFVFALVNRTGCGVEELLHPAPTPFATAAPLLVHAGEKAGLSRSVGPRLKIENQSERVNH